MTETKIYIGLNDAATKQQVHLTELYVKVMKHVCQSYHVSFSFIVTEGGYFYENGDYVSLDFEDDSRVGSLPFTLELESGHYLLSTGRRYNDGTVLSRLEFFELKPNDNLHKELVFRDLTTQNRDLGKLTTQHISFDKTAYFNKNFDWKTDNGKIGCILYGCFVFFCHFAEFHFSHSHHLPVPEDLSAPAGKPAH